MRKTSQDGGDSTSITSGVENEFKKSAMKSKKSSLKRKAANFSHDSDDTVIEPLLQKDRDKSEGAKFNTKVKTDTNYEKGYDKSKQLNDNKSKTSSTTGFCGTTESLLSSKDYEVTKSTTSGVTAPLHNYMNTNVFNTHENIKPNITTKSQILVEIDGTKQSGNSPGPLIFTTAKIHTDGKSKNMEPVQVTSVPILSTIEVSVSKGGSIVTTNEKKVSNGTSNPIYSISSDKIKDEIVSNNSLHMKTNISSENHTNTAKYVNKISNNSSVQSTVPTVSNTKDKPSSSKIIQRDQSLELGSQSLNKDSTKNNELEKAKSNIKVDFSKQICSDIKSPVSSVSDQITTISAGSIGNKQLQRQKTLIEDTILPKTQIKANIEDLSAKTYDISKEKIPKSSANTENVAIKSPLCTPTAPISTSITLTNIYSPPKTESINSSLLVFETKSTTPITTSAAMANKTATQQSTSKCITQTPAVAPSSLLKNIPSTSKTNSSTEGSKVPTLTAAKPLVTKSMTHAAMSTNKVSENKMPVVESIKLDVDEKLELNVKQSPTPGSTSDLKSPISTKIINTLTKADDTTTARLSSVKQPIPSSNTSKTKPSPITSTKPPITTTHTKTSSTPSAHINSSQISEERRKKSPNENIVLVSSSSITGSATSPASNLKKDKESNAKAASISKTSSSSLAMKNLPAINMSSKKPPSVIKTSPTTTSSISTTTANTTYLSGKSSSTKLPLASSSSSTIASGLNLNQKINTDSTQKGTKKSDVTACSSTPSVNPPPKVSSTIQKIDSKSNETKKNSNA